MMDELSVICPAGGTRNVASLSLNAHKPTAAFFRGNNAPVGLCVEAGSASVTATEHLRSCRTMKRTGIGHISAPTLSSNNRTDRDVTAYRHRSSDHIPTFPYKTVAAALSPHSPLNMSLEWYFVNIKDENTAAAFLREKGLLHRDRSCLTCHHQMRLGSRCANGAPQWRCTNSARRARISARTGTWFPKPVELTEGHRPYPGVERQDEHDEILQETPRYAHCYSVPVHHSFI
ncbi:hypothetical protein M513_13982 [Trichuris suis]|uniref:Uncharacterized protein n=1 Tax=Trichuris suis TaxID=68888 RepID=A0A085LJJ4_9BILA|nr:hypothetical protein M513_13982 [Trichuris suis]